VILARFAGDDPGVGEDSLILRQGGPEFQRMGDHLQYVRAHVRDIGKDIRHEDGSLPGRLLSPWPWGGSGLPPIPLANRRTRPHW
jgi:hypothetical protein